MKKQSFVKGVVLLTAAGIIIKLFGFMYRVVLTNLPGYGDEGNGIYGAGYQVYLVLYALSTTGFPSAISKLVAEKMAVHDWRGAHRIFKVSFWLLFFIGSAFSVLFFISSGYIARAIGNSRTVYTMLALSPTIFFVSLMAVFRGYFQGMQDMRPQANSQIIEQLSKTVFTIALAYFLMPYGIEIAAAGATLGTTIGAAVGAVYLFNLYNRRKIELWGNIRNFYKKGKHEPIARIIKNLFKISVPISFGAVILTAASIIDLATVMKQLGKAGFDAKRANELYGILTGKCNVLTHLPVAVCLALATSLVPAIAGAMASGNLRAVSNKISASLRLTVIISLPSSAGIAILAGPILKMLFPNSSEGAYLLTISASTIVFVGLTQTLSGILQGLGKVLVPALSLLAGAVAKVLVNYLLIPLPGINIVGAVYGTLACYVISTTINIIALKRNFRLNLSIQNFIIKPVAATVVMSFCTFYSYFYVFRMMQSNHAATAISIMLSVVVFGIAMLLMGGVTDKDISTLPFGDNICRLLSRAKLLRR